MVLKGSTLTESARESGNNRLVMRLIKPNRDATKMVLRSVNGEVTHPRATCVASSTLMRKAIWKALSSALVRKALFIRSATTKMTGDMVSVGRIRQVNRSQSRFTRKVRFKKSAIKRILS